MASEPFSRKRLIIAVMALVALRAAMVAAAPPSLIGAGLDFLGISPNSDRVQDEARFFYELASDTARVSVLVHVDAAGAPGNVIDTLAWNEPKPVGPDTLIWAGVNAAGVKVAEGKYWITASAENVDGSFAVTPLSILVDIVAPRDSLSTPTRSFQPTLVHRVTGAVFDKNGLAHLTVTLAAEGKLLANPLCAPCANDTTPFDLFVPDSLAATDSLRITIDAVDPAGNGRPRVQLVVVDSLPPPAPVIDPIPSPVDRDSVLVEGTASEAESVFVDLDGALAVRVRTLQGFRFEARLRRFAQGTHTVVALSQDRAGNLSPLSLPASFLYQETLGIVLPERFLLGQYLQVNLSKPASAVILRVYDLTGRLVKRLEDRSTKTIYEFAWDGRDENGNPVGSGPYIVGVEANYVDGSRLAKRAAMVVTR